MLKQVMTKPGEIIFEEAQRPVPGENQVLIKIMNIRTADSHPLYFD